MFPETNPTDLAFLCAGILVGLLMGIAGTSAVFYPKFAKGIARVKGVALLAVGTGLLVWGIVALSTGSEFKPPFHTNFMRNAVECIAWGSGVFLIGLLSFILGFVGVFPQREAD